MQAICSSLLPFLLPSACIFAASSVSFSFGIHAVLILLVSCNIKKKNRKFEIWAKLNNKPIRLILSPETLI
jgi:hypothetical protein